MLWLYVLGINLYAIGTVLTFKRLNRDKWDGTELPPANLVAIVWPVWLPLLCVYELALFQCTLIYKLAEFQIRLAKASKRAAIYSIKAAKSRKMLPKAQVHNKRPNWQPKLR